MVRTRPSTGCCGALLALSVGCLTLVPASAHAGRWSRIKRGIQRHMSGASTSLRRCPVPVLGKKNKRHKPARWETGGGVVLDLERHKVLLLRVRKERKEGRNGWTLPKGKIDPGESPLAATVRETREETGGLQPRVVGKLARYRSSRALRHYFLMTARPGQVKHLEQRRRALKQRPKKRRYLDEHREVLDARWVSLKQARKLLQRGRDRRVLRAAEDALRGLERDGRRHR